MMSNANKVIVAMFIAEMAATFESAMIFGALPTLIGDFGDPETVVWLVTMHSLISAATYAVAGRLGDIRGRKQVMLVLIVIAICGSVLSAVSSSFAMVLAGRALQGFGSAVLPLSIGILRENLPDERIPVSIGLMTTASGAGVVLGLFLGGAIIDNLDWHWLFAASAVLLAIAFVVVQLLVPARQGTPTKHRIDWIEGLLPAPTIMLLLLGLSFTKTFGWLDWRVGALLAAGLLLLVYWAKRALASPSRSSTFASSPSAMSAAGNLLAALLALGTANVVMIFSTYIQSPAWTGIGLGLTATMYAAVKLPSNIVSFFAGPISGWLIQRRGSRTPVVIGGLLSGTGWLVAMGMPSTAIQASLLICWISFGTTLLNAAIPNIIVAAVPPDRTSEAIGAMSVMRGFFTAIGAQIVGLMLAAGTLAAPDGKSHFPSKSGYYAAMMWIAAMCFVAAACAVLLRGHGAAKVGPVVT